MSMEFRKDLETGVKVTTAINITASITFTEGELRALDALVGYGDDAFLRAFYVKLGTAYMKPFERDLRDLFARIRSTVPAAIRTAEEHRKALGLPKGPHV